MARQDKPHGSGRASVCSVAPAVSAAFRSTCLISHLSLATLHAILALSFALSVATESQQRHSPLLLYWYTRQLASFSSLGNLCRHDHRHNGPILALTRKPDRTNSSPALSQFSDLKQSERIFRLALVWVAPSGRPTEPSNKLAANSIFPVLAGNGSGRASQRAS